MSRSQNFDLSITCDLDDEYFADWNDMSPELQAFWTATDKQPGCEGSGAITPINCDGCPFCKHYEVDES